MIQATKQHLTLTTKRPKNKYNYQKGLENYMIYTSLGERCGDYGSVTLTQHEGYLVMV